MGWQRALGIAALVITTCCSTGRAAPIGYDAMMVSLRSAASSGRVRVARIGVSVRKRSIPVAIIGPDTAPVRVLVLCRQHGDEPSSTGAALRVVHRAACGEAALRRALSGTQLLIVPMVNPDGAQLFSRENANGADLNRDWGAFTQPETRAVAALYRRLRPQVVLDEHQWTVRDGRGSDFLESGAPGRRTVAMQRILLEGNPGVALRSDCAGPDMDKRLAHRYFAGAGAMAFLLETTPAVPESTRIRLYERMIVRAGHAASLYAGVQPVCGQASQLPCAFHPTPDQSPLRVPWFAMSFVAIGCVLIFFTSTSGRSGTGAQSDPISRGIQRVPLTGVGDLPARLQRRRLRCHAGSSAAK